jgi:hypothetical protein
MLRTTALATVAIGISVGLGLGCNLPSDARPASYPPPPVGSYTSAAHQMTGGGKTASVSGASVTPEFFAAAMVRPMLGRAFVPADHQASGTAVVLLSYELWQRMFGRAPDVVGKTIQIDGRPVTIVGVMPKGFEFPKGTDVWTPQ